MKHWDATARAYIEGCVDGLDDIATETFGPLGDYTKADDINWPFGWAGSNGDRDGGPTVAAKWPGGCHHCGHGAKSCICPGPSAYLRGPHDIHYADAKARATGLNLDGSVRRETLPHNDNRPRRGDWMETFTGRKFWPLDPRQDDVDILDIAHALSMQCRYGGHSLRFYSVAEHSVLMARNVAPQHALWALMHDAAEAYLADVPRPLKRNLVGYKEAEAKVMAAICDHFDMPRLMPAEVHSADERILSDEIHQNMHPMEWHAKHNDPLGVTLLYWPPERAEIYFLDAFRKIVRGEGRVAA